MNKWKDGTAKSQNNAFAGVIHKPEESETERREAAMTKVAAKRTHKGQFGSIERLSAAVILKARRHGGAYSKAVSLPTEK